MKASVLALAALMGTSAAYKLREFQHASVDDYGFIVLGQETFRYSDELANGDSADDREIHEEEDINDAVVDYNGHTNAGYGAKENVDFFRGNVLPAGHFVTEPRA